MAFLSPLFLLGLIAWGAISVWLLWGRRQRTDVPFLEFWREAAEETHARRRMKVPPIAVALAIAAMLLAILAASRPVMLGVGTSRGPRITVIVDRGITMSATENQTIRFRAAASAAQIALIDLGYNFETVDFLTVPGETTPRVLWSDWTPAVASLAPTALETSEALQSAIAARLSAGDGTILVISDQDLHRHDPRLIQIAPDHAADDVGISAIAARTTPRAQVMVRVRNQSSQISAPLIVRSGDESQTRQIDLPPRGEERDYFIDLPQLNDTVEAMLDVHDDISADNHAWLVRERNWPRIVASQGVSPELRRMIAVYESRHAPSGVSQALSIVNRLEDLPQTGPAIIDAAATAAPGATAVQTVDHPITRHIHWDVLAPTLLCNTDAPYGWLPLVSVGGHTIVAARDGPARQVWVGFGGSQWPASAEFVIFWANVFDWAGQGGERFVSHDLQELTPQWHLAETGSSAAWGQPGIYENGRRLVAFNAPAPDLTPPPQTNWRAALFAWSRETGRGIPFGPFALLLALGCLAASAMTWRRSRRSGLTPPSHSDRVQEPEGLLSR